MRVTVVQESRTDTTTTYRWFADSADNQPATGVDIAVGTGLIVFDSEGKVIDVTNSTAAVERRQVASASPLEFELHFEELSGLAVASSELAAARQDGSPPGTLSSFLIGEDGTLRGVFSNGVTRDLGQIRLARFANPTGLQQKGENLFAAGVNSGLPIQANPGEQGIGRIIAGAVELSNTDIGGNLIDLILASTQYRSNARVIDAAQRLLDELLNLRR
jgi:flagellar hook protein FlgE